MTLEELKDLIQEVSGKEVSSLVESQIERLSQEGFTYKEIGRCVWYFFKILGNDTEKIDRYGIGIVNRFRGAANSYYDKLKERQEKQIIAAERFKELQLKEVEIKPYRRIFQKKGVDINEL